MIPPCLRPWFGRFDALLILAAVGLMVLSCETTPRVVEATPTTLDQAEVKRRIALDEAAVANVVAQGNAFLLALYIGGGVGLVGLLLVALAVAFGWGKKIVMLGGALILFGAVTVMVSMSFPHYGEEIALGAALLAGSVLLFAAVMGALVARHWYLALRQTVEVNEAAKGTLADEQRAVVYGDGGLANRVMSDKTKKIVSKLRKDILKPEGTK